MAASGQVTNAYWPAVLMGLGLLLSLVATTIARAVRVHRARHPITGLPPADGLADLWPSGMGPSLWRCQALIPEAITVRQLLSGDIDAETYRIRMSDLARQANPERRSQRNA
jgi:hypothetical protein